MYGRGHSDAPITAYSEYLFVNQTEELIRALEKKGILSPNQKFDFFGYSLGGAVAVVYSVSYPERIKSLMLMAPAGLPLKIPLMAGVSTWPGVGLIFKHTLLGRYILEARVPAAFARPNEFPDAIKDYTMILYQHLHKEGFFEALTSTLSHFSGLLSRDLVEAYKKVGEAKFPVLLLWGSDDKTVPANCSIAAKEAISRAELVIFENCGHVPQVEKQKELLSVVHKFMQSHL